MTSNAAVQGEQGGAVVFLHTPPRLELMVDLTTWKVPKETADCFVVTGIKSGSHFVGRRLDAVGRNEGLVIWLSPRQVAVFEWDERLELFLPVWDEAELFRYQRGHDNLSLLQQSVMYPFEQWTVWEELTYAITPQLVENVQKPLIESLQENVAAVTPHALDSMDLDDFAKIRAEDYVRTEPDKVEEAQFPLAWTDIPPIKKDLNTSKSLAAWCAASLARVSASPTSVFDDQLLRSVAKYLHLSESETLFLGELQLAYIHFILGCNLSAFEHWKAYYKIMPLANSIYDDNASLGCHWMRILASQLSLIPSDFHSSDITQNNFIVAAALDTLDYTTDHENSSVSREANMLKVIAHSS